MYVGHVFQKQHGAFTLPADCYFHSVFSNDANKQRGQLGVNPKINIKKGQTESFHTSCQREFETTSISKDLKVYV